MKKRYTSKLTTEQAMQKLETGLVELIRSGEWVHYLKMQSQFHRYSFRNIILILTHFPNATRVAGLRTWNKLGRYVKPGEKGIPILRPQFAKVDEE